MQSGDGAGFFDPDEIDGPDEMHVRLPDGIISLRGGSWGGEFEWHGIVDFKVAVAGCDPIVGVMSSEQAMDLRDLLDDCIRAATTPPGEGADVDS